MPFEQRAELRVSVDGQFVIEVTDTWGTKQVVLSRSVSRARAEALIKTQDGEQTKRSDR